MAFAFGARRVYGNGYNGYDGYYGNGFTGYDKYGYECDSAEEWQWDDSCGEWVRASEAESPTWWQHDNRDDFESPVKTSRRLFAEHPRQSRQRAAMGDTCTREAYMDRTGGGDDEEEEEGIVDNLIDMVDHLLQSHQKQQELVGKLLKRCAGDEGDLALTPPKKQRRSGIAGVDSGKRSSATEDVETEYDEGSEDAQSCSGSSVRSRGRRNAFDGSPLGSTPTDANAMDWPLSRSEKQERAHDLGRKIWASDAEALRGDVAKLQRQVDRYESARAAKGHRA